MSHNLTVITNHSQTLQLQPLSNAHSNYPPIDTACNFLYSQFSQYKSPTDKHQHNLRKTINRNINLHEVESRMTLPQMKNGSAYTEEHLHKSDHENGNSSTQEEKSQPSRFDFALALNAHKDKAPSSTFL